MPNLHIIEGPKNVGKTYLLQQSGFRTYKFPFISYFEKFLKTDNNNTGANDKTTYHFTTSYDITLLSMFQAGLLDKAQPSVIDRGFISNLVLGVLQGRITDEDAYKFMDFLNEQGYLKNLVIVYVDKDDKQSGRKVDKDQWEYLGYEAQDAKFREYLSYYNDLTHTDFIEFKNDFTPEAVTQFKGLIKVTF